MAGTATVYFTVDLNDVTVELEKIDELHANLDSYCKQAETLSAEVVSNSCGNFVSNSRKLKMQLKTRIDKMTIERFKRGLMNFIGSTERFLFGTMDAKDKKKIKQNLSDLKNDQMINGIVIEKVISSVNETDSVLNKHTEIMKQFDDNIQRLSIGYQNTEAKFNFMTHFDETKQTYLMMFYELDKKVDEIHQTLIDLHNNVLNSKLIDINEIIDGMVKININKNIRLPFERKEVNYDDVRKLLKFVVAKKENVLVLVFSLQLIENDLFSLSRIYAIPYVVDQVAYFVDIKRKFMIKDKHVEKWAPLKQEELDKCIQGSFYVCERLKILNTDKESCEGAIVSNGIKKLENFCSIKAIMIPKVTVIKMETINSFLIMSRELIKAKLVKDDGVKDVEFIDNQIIRASDAVLHVENLELTFVGAITLFEKFDLKMTNWDLEKTELHIDKVEQLNLPRVSLPAILKTDELNMLGKDMELIRKERIFREEKEKDSSSKLTSDIIVGISIAILFVAVVYVGINQRMRIKKYYLSVFDKEDTSKPKDLTRSEINLIESATA